jgi:predicted DNA-binding transcriptional regulator YafY
METDEHIRSPGYNKDRTARLMKLQLLLYLHPEGLKIKEIAEKCSVSLRTTYRDLELLEGELGVPIWEQQCKRGVAEGYFLQPITFTPSESMNIFLAIRLMQQFTHIYNPNVISTFMKLATIVPPSLRKQIQGTLDFIAQHPKDERNINNLNKITQAWLSHNRVKITYQLFSDETPREHIIEPYFIEPLMIGHSNYLIANECQKKATCVIKIDCIIGEVSIQEDTYTIPADFNAIDYLNSKWGTSIDSAGTSEDIETVKLHFSQRMSRVVTPTVWHPSQHLEPQDDGSVIMTVQTNISVDFFSWILGWGPDVVVLEPEPLRKRIVQRIKEMGSNYIHARVTANTTDATVEKIKSLAQKGISDDQWKLILGLLPPEAETGRPRKDSRKIMEGIFWKFKNGANWKDIPREYGTSSTCFYRYKNLTHLKLWDRIYSALSANPS